MVQITLADHASHVELSRSSMHLLKTAGRRCKSHQVGPWNGCMTPGEENLPGSIAHTHRIASDVYRHSDDQTSQGDGWCGYVKPDFVLDELSQPRVSSILWAAGTQR